MARSFLLIGAISMSLLCFGIANLNSLKDVIDDFEDLLETKDIVINTLHDYIQDQIKRLVNLRKHIGHYSKNHEKAINKVARIFTRVNRKILENDEEEIMEEADEGDISHLSKYAGTKYEKLCNGEPLLPADIQKKLKCQYVDHGIPFLKIGPFKEEEAYLNPRIVVYHDVIYEEEIKALKKLSKPRLEDAKLLSVVSGKPETTNQRIGKNAWFSDDEYKIVKVISRRVEYMTNLTIETSEQLQVAYYGIGGLYEPHFDFAREKDPNFFEGLNTGNRIATVLYYMNDVPKGGATVFTALNVTLWPKKGSAAFWHNLKRNGKGDILTIHAACPVLSGTKWIANKWLHEKGQEFRRPCSLTENE